MSAILASGEVKPIVEKLIKAFPTSLGHVDSDRIVYVRCPGKKRAASIKSIPTPYDLFVNEKFILTIYTNRFDNLDPNRQAVAIFDELLRIKDFDAGKLAGYSVVSNYETVARWGADWDTSEEDLEVFGTSK